MDSLPRNVKVTHTYVERTIAFIDAPSILKKVHQRWKWYLHIDKCKPQHASCGPIGLTYASTFTN